MARIATTTTPEPELVQHVKYVGTADVRRISKAEWANINVEQDTLEWNAGNKFMLPAADMAAGALEYFKSDDGFSIVEA